MKPSARRTLGLVREYGRDVIGVAALAVLAVVLPSLPISGAQRNVWGAAMVVVIGLCIADAIVIDRRNRRNKKP